MKKRILIIDDDLDMCILLNRFLSRNGYEVEEAHDGQHGIEKFKQSDYDFVICDYWLGDKEGKEVLEEIKACDPTAIVLITTGFSDIKTAVDVIKSGAYDYITKPIVPAEILSILENATKESTGLASTTEKEKKTNKKSEEDNFLQGKSKQSKELYRQVDIIANTDYSVILYGESGTGKEVIAKTIHQKSRRRDRPFIPIDCGTLSRELSGSELFGHMKGAFTGALADKEGWFEMANGGTLFLDEVANLSSAIQASLLRVIQERTFKRVGGTNEIPLDIRIIVASNEDLQDAQKKGKFRDDLYHRFNEFSINIPRLSDRAADIPMFADFFLQRTNAELGKSIIGFDDEVMELFASYSWPGNLREMKNVISRAALLTDDQKISATALPFEITAEDEKMPRVVNIVLKPSIINISKKDNHLKESTAKAEYEAILNALQRVNFNKSKAAELLNIHPKTLYNKIRSYDTNWVTSATSE